MEVIPFATAANASDPGILHACGGDPDQLELNHILVWVFSTHVEVILHYIVNCVPNASILHACGGDPL